MKAVTPKQVPKSCYDSASTLLQNATATLLQTTLVQNGKRAKKCDIYYKIRKFMYCAEVA